jgi:hypothetical protein
VSGQRRSVETFDVDIDVFYHPIGTLLAFGDFVSAQHGNVREISLL